METFIGLDGFRGGWVAAWIDKSGGQGFDYSTTLDRLLSYPHSRAMIDIPIGLPERDYRLCDVQARELLGPHVFPGARRNLWTFESVAQANAHYWASGQKGISCQLWGIRCKIKQIDELMTPERQQRLKETHPELVFRRLNGEAALPNKKTEAGRRRRVDLLKNGGFVEIERWLNLRYGTGIACDDLIDACACALAARDAKHRLPQDGDDPDSKGLRMQMWF